ncbi:hypothetical protein Barb7_02727 [Bacteroidales bacterium Barb7]|nr:hypothetical protein Barb7_02727 [Bacteroidales bacterium Barb7]
MFAAKPFLHQRMQSVFEYIQPDMFHHIGSKSHTQHHAGILFGNAATLHIKKSLLVQLPRTHTVRTFHIIGIDFQLRLAVHTGFAGQAEVAVGLGGLCLLSVFFHPDTTAENCRSLFIHHILHQFLARAMRCGMDNAAVRIRLLPLVKDGHGT